jgi:hypothetical protein
MVSGRKHRHPSKWTLNRIEESGSVLSKLETWLQDRVYHSLTDFEAHLVSPHLNWLQIEQDSQN